MTGQRDDCIRWLLGQPPDQQYEVKGYKPRRSLSANAYFHVLCQKIAEKLGVSLSHVKNTLMAEFGQIDPDLPAVVMPDDFDWRENPYLHLHPTQRVKEMNGKLWRVFYVIRGSHTYTSAEMKRLIDGAIAEAKAQDIETLPPHELARMMASWKGEQ